MPKGLSPFPGTAEAAAQAGAGTAQLGSPQPRTPLAEELSPAGAGAQHRDDCGSCCSGPRGSSRGPGDAAPDPSPHPGAGRAASRRGSLEPAGMGAPLPPPSLSVPVGSGLAPAPERISVLAGTGTGTGTAALGRSAENFCRSRGGGGCGGSGGGTGTGGGTAGEEPHPAAPLLPPARGDAARCPPPRPAGRGRSALCAARTERPRINPGAAGARALVPAAVSSAPGTGSAPRRGRGGRSGGGSWTAPAPRQRDRYSRLRGGPRGCSPGPSEAAESRGSPAAPGLSQHSRPRRGPGQTLAAQPGAAPTPAFRPRPAATGPRLRRCPAAAPGKHIPAPEPRAAAWPGQVHRPRGPGPWAPTDLPWADSRGGHGGCDSSGTPSVLPPGTRPALPPELAAARGSGSPPAGSRSLEAPAGVERAAQTPGHRLALAGASPALGRFRLTAAPPGHSPRTPRSGPGRGHQQPQPCAGCGVTAGVGRGLGRARPAGRAQTRLLRAAGRAEGPRSAMLRDKRCSRTAELPARRAPGCVWHTLSCWGGRGTAQPP